MTSFAYWRKLWGASRSRRKSPRGDRSLNVESLEDRALFAIDIEGPATIVENGVPVYSANVTYGSTGNGFYRWQMLSPTGTVLGEKSGAFIGNSIPDFSEDTDDDGAYTIRLRLSVNASGTSGVETKNFSLTVTNDTPVPAITGPTAGDEGETLTFSGSFTDAGAEFDGPYDYTWTVRDANDDVVHTQKGSVDWGDDPGDLSWTPTDDGEYTVRLVVEDKDGAQGTFSVTVDVADLPAAIDVQGPTSGDRGDQVSFGGTITEPSGGDDGPYDYTWTITGPGGFTDTVSGTAANSSFVDPYTFTPSELGTYTITFSVTDAHGDVQTTTHDFESENADPVPSITGPTEGDEGSSVTFSGSFTDEADDGAYTYTWNAYDADGNLVETSSGSATEPGDVGDFNFTPPAYGDYTITLTVEGLDGTVGETTFDFEALDVLATPSIDPTPSGSEGSPVTVTGSISDPGAGESYEYVWTVTGPGGYSDTASGTAAEGAALSFTFTPPQDGTYTVTLKIRSTSEDADDDEVSTVGTVIVGNVPPLVTIDDPGPGVQGAPVNVNGSFTDPGEDEDAPYSYTWTVTGPDGYVYSESGTVTATGDVPTLTFVPVGAGDYEVRLTIEDDDDAVFQVITVSVGNAAPDPVVTGPTTGPEGSPATFSGSFTDAGEEADGPYTYLWEVLDADGNVIGSATDSVDEPGDVPDFSFTPENNGAYTVRLTVTDALGDSDLFEFDFAALNVAPDVTVDDPADAPQGTPITVDGSFTDPGEANDAPYSYTWTVTGPGNFSQSFSGMSGATGDVPSYTFTPVGAGVYTVTLTVSDGEDSTSESVTVTALNEPPVVSVGGPGSTDEGTQVTFSGLFTDIGLAADGSYSYLWEAIDSNGHVAHFASGTMNAPGAPPDFDFTPNDDGEYTIRLTITDAHNGEGVAETTLDVANVAPTVTVVDPPPAVQGDTVTVGGSFADPAESGDAPYPYTWTVTGPNGFTYSQSGTANATGGVTPLSFTPITPGTYTITLSVSDDHETRSDSKTLTVTNAAPTPTVDGPATGPEGSPATFNGSFTDPGGAGDGTYNYTWEVVDSNGNVVYSTGGTAASPDSIGSITYTPLDNGVYTIRLTVVDALGESGSRDFTFTAANVPPTVTVDDPPSAPQGSTVVVGGAFTDPAGPRDANYSYTWTVTGPNGFTHTVTGTATATGSVPELSFVANGAGTYTIRLTIVDNDGGAGFEESTFVAINAPPVVTVDPPSGASEGSPITFTGSFTDPGGAADGDYTYRWRVYNSSGVPVASFVDTVAEPGTVSYTWTPPDDGEYTVTLEVIDVALGSGLAEAEFSVANVAPDVVIADPGAGVQGMPITLNGSFTDPAGVADAPYSYTWTITGPGGFSQTVSSNAATPGPLPPIVFTPIGAGTYTVRLTVNDGSEDGAAEITVTVGNTAPDPSLSGPTSTNEGTTVTYNGSFTDVGQEADGPYTYTWRVRDSNGNVVASSNGSATSPGTVPSFNYTPPDDGTYTIELVVRDRLGASATESLTLTVANVVPTVVINGPTNFDEGNSATYTAVVTDPAGANDGPYTYIWTLRDSNGDIVRSELGFAAAPGDVPSFVLGAGDDGLYTLTLEVWEDGDLIGDSDTISITVNNVPPQPTINGPTNLTEGSTATYTGSFTDPGGTHDGPYTYTWSYTDAQGVTHFVSGMVTAPGSVPSLTVQWGDDGIYSVRLTIEEGSGSAAIGTVVFDTIVVDVPPAPIIDGPTSGTEGSSVTYTGSFSDPAGANDGSYTYNWTVTGPGFTQTYTSTRNTPGAVDSFTFTPPDNGTYTVTLSVTDADGVTSAPDGTLTLVVDNVAPTIGNYYFADPVTRAPLAFVNEGQQVLLIGYITDPGERDTYRITIDPRDGGGTRTVNITSPVRDADGRIVFDIEVLYLFPGVYSVTTTVVDNDGGTSREAQQLVVSDIPGFSVSIDPPPVVTLPLLPPTIALAPPVLAQSATLRDSLQSVVLSGGSGGEAPASPDARHDIKIKVQVDLLSGFRGRWLRTVFADVLYGDQVEVLLTELRKLEPGIYRLTLASPSTQSQVLEIQVDADGGRTSVSRVSEFWSDYSRRNVQDHFNVDFFTHRASNDDAAQAALESLSQDYRGGRFAPVAPRDSELDAYTRSGADAWSVGLVVAEAAPPALPPDSPAPPSR